jgi:hypothetical protein
MHKCSISSKVPNPYSMPRTVLNWNSMTRNNTKRDVIRFSVKLKIKTSVGLKNISNCALHKSVLDRSGGL